MFNLGEAILALLEIVFGFWNNQDSPLPGSKEAGPGGSLKGLNPFLLG